MAGTAACACFSQERTLGANMRVAGFCTTISAQEPCGVPSGLPSELVRLIRRGRVIGGPPRRGRFAQRSLGCAWPDASVPAPVLHPRHSSVVICQPQWHSPFDFLPITNLISGSWEVALP
jgi:hypothetical protein